MLFNNLIVVGLILVIGCVLFSLSLIVNDNTLIANNNDNTLIANEQYSSLPTVTLISYDKTFKIQFLCVDGYKFVAKYSYNLIQIFDDKGNGISCN